MIEAKFTPGPWHIESDDADIGDIPFIPIATQLQPRGWKMVCKVEPAIDDDAHVSEAFSLGEEQRATARLIAAAPELLEALEAVLSWGEGYLPASVEKDARAAVAKAKSETGDQE